MRNRQRLLSDEQWTLVEPLLPPPKRRKDKRGRPAAPPRACFEGILWILQTGAAWRFLPEKGRPRQKPKRVIADTAYDSDPLRERLHRRTVGDEGMRTVESCAVTSVAGSWSEPILGWDNFADCWFVMSSYSPPTVLSSISPACGLPSGGIFETHSTQKGLSNPVVTRYRSLLRFSAALLAHRYTKSAL